MFSAPREKPVAVVRPVPSQQRGVQPESRDVPTRCSPPPSLDHAVRPPDVANLGRIRSALRSYAVRLQRRPLVAGTKTRTSGSRLSATHQECAREHFLSRSPEFLGNGGVFHIGSNQRERSAAGSRSAPRPNIRGRECGLVRWAIRGRSRRRADPQPRPSPATESGARVRRRSRLVPRFDYAHT